MQPSDANRDTRAAHPPRPHAVLILASHDSTASMLSSFVTLSGHTAVMPLDDEGLEQAMLRVRPRVIIIDFDHPCAASPRTDRRLARLGARVVLCSAWHRSTEARPRAAEMGSLFFALPIEHKDFDLLLRTAMLL